jgi:hypothetical protein
MFKKASKKMERFCFAISITGQAGLILGRMMP